MKALFEKFPVLHISGERIIWDSRQQVSADEPKRVFIFPETLKDPNLLGELKNLTKAQFITPVGAGFGKEVPSVKGELGITCSRALLKPSQKLRVIGVTGTNGKSSCVEILRHELQGLGRTVLQIGTLGVSLWKPDQATAFISEETGFTTPLSPQLHFLFSRALEEGATDVVMEVSSHAVAEERVAGVDFDGALFTNLTQDHLDYHGDMESYFLAKVRFFTDLLMRSSKKQKGAVINVGSEYGARLMESLSEASFPVLGVSVDKDITVQSHSLRGLKFEVKGLGSFQSRLIGKHNLENLLVCLKALQEFEGKLGKKLPAILETFPGVRGRLQRVGPEGPFVFVDYAHTPDALEKVLKTLAELKETKSRLHVIFGCGGDRDRGKRPIMGRIAAELADQVVLTSDNPRTEEPSAILDEILSGVPANRRAKAIVEVDRKNAIVDTLKRVGRDDIVLIAGKGHEDYQILGTTKRPFSDVGIVQDFFGALS